MQPSRAVDQYFFQFSAFSAQDLDRAAQLINGGGQLVVIVTPHMLRELELFVVAKSLHGEVAAVAGVRAAPPYGELCYFVVAPPHRRAGLATHLKGLLLSAAREQGIRGLFGSVRRGNRGAERMMQAHRFQRLGHWLNPESGNTLIWYYRALDGASSSLRSYLLRKLGYEPLWTRFIARIKRRLGLAVSS